MLDQVRRDFLLTVALWGRVRENYRLARGAVFALTWFALACTALVVHVLVRAVITELADRMVRR